MTEENERKINDCRLELNNISNWINKNNMHSNVRYLVAYSVVKASGTIEIIFKSMIYDLLAENVKLETQNYLTKMVIDSSCNPNTGNMSKILEQIDSDRKSGFDRIIKETTRGTEQKADLNSLVNLRNDIAHGRTIGSTINTVKRYFESGVAILNMLEKVLSDSSE